MTLRIPPPCAPAEMPDLRLDLLASWRKPAWRRTAVSGVRRAREVNTIHENFAMPLAAAADHFVRYEERTLTDAELWWIGEEMCDLLFETSTKVPADVRVEHFTMPSPSGLAVFAKPWAGTDAIRSDTAVIVDAITWGHANIGTTETGVRREALSVSHYRLLRFEDGLAQNELNLAVAVGAFDRAQHRPIEKGGTVSFSLHGAAWVPLGRSDWPVDDSVGDVESYLDVQVDDSAAREVFLSSAREDRRLIASLALLLNTRTVAALDAGHLPRQTRRRSQRHGVSSDVNVVTMRRPEHHGDEHELDPDRPPVEWSHRWIVSAHPRLQPYGPGRSMRRLIMVPPHVKGPDDKPLVVKPTVKAWVR